jgi:cyclic pyranopterin phosphate synthase
MRDVSFKATTRRSATARAVLTADPATITTIKEGRVPKGDPLAVAKVAAVMAAKKTVDWIPYCHPIPIEFVDVKFELGSDRVTVDVEVVSVAKTGVEMEAMTAAASAALNLYDMLKMIDESMEIESITLLEKRGGKSDFQYAEPWRAAVLVVSDRVSAGTAEDLSGRILVAAAEERGASSVEYAVVSDEPDQIRSAVTNWGKEGVDLILVTGGTGVSPRDRTPEALENLFDLKLPGIAEALRRYGQERLPTSMVSRSIAGVVGQSIVVSLPGSPSACKDAVSVLFPGVLHARTMLAGGSHG